MKTAPKTNTFVTIDTRHRRLDIQPWLAAVLAFSVVLWWSFAAATPTAHDFLARLVSASVCAALLWMLVWRLGASRTSTLVVLTLGPLLLGRYSAAEVAVVSVFIALVIALQEYFVKRFKTTAVVVMVFAGVLAADSGSYGKPLLILFVAALFSRVLWHALIERVHRKVFVLFAAKAMAMVVIAPVVYVSLRHLSSWQADLPTALPAVHLSVWVAIIAGVFALRGVWSVLLLKTGRSPAERGLRLFYICFGAGVVGIVALLQHYGDQIFAPTLLSKLVTFGLTGYTIVGITFVVAALVLSVSAGIDRSLYLDASFGRLVWRSFRLPFVAPGKDERPQIAERKRIA